MKLESLLKLGVFLSREDILIRGMSEAIDEWKNGRTAQEVFETFFCKRLTDLVSREKVFSKIYDEITNLFCQGCVVTSVIKTL